ncbi:O-antigen ligase family protein [Flavipsychrobacter stenotrophus]|nr:O-antigen ligase family protein [Flavipsychrobacter stenotrophus]
MNKELIIPLTSKKETLRELIRRLFLVEKLNNKFGFGLLLLFCMLIAAVISLIGVKEGMMIIIGMIAIPIVYGIVAYPKFGIFVYLSMAYLLMWFIKIGVNFPLGTVMDGMEALFILSLFIKQKRDKDWSMFKGPVSTVILIWIGYNFFQIANPTAESRLAWVYTVRTVAVVMIMYFIFLYYITTKLIIKLIFRLWICLALFGALYGLKQEYIGFFPFEDAYLHSDPGIELLLFIGGVWRKFSIFSDPVAFSYNMVTASLVCIGLMTGPVSRAKRIILGCLVVIFLMAMLSSGTRGAYVLLPAGVILLCVLKYNKKVLLALIIGAVMATGIIFVPTSNNTLYRFQTAFKPNDDPSFNLRKMNQKRIQPYILSHPLGGGLGATGEWGKRFAPYSYLANFPPDSGYVRIAVELGWIGLFLFCLLVFTVLKTGINSYFIIKDPKLRSYCLAAVLVVFALNVGNYPQEAIVQYPSNVYFYLVIAIIGVTLRLDKQQNKLLDAGK